MLFPNLDKQLPRHLSGSSFCLEDRIGESAALDNEAAITRLPLGSVCIYARRYGHGSGQVFGLAGYLLTPASQFRAEPVPLVGAFVPAHRCGAVPDFHRIPFSVRSQKQTPEAVLV